MEIFFAFLIFCLILTLGFLVKFLMKKIGVLNDSYNQLLKKNILEDLDLATTEQLFDEIKKRNDRPFIIIFPEDKNKKLGIKIDVCSLTPEQLLEILKMSMIEVTRCYNKMNNIQNDDL